MTVLLLDSTCLRLFRSLHAHMIHFSSEYPDLARASNYFVTFSKIYSVGWSVPYLSLTLHTIHWFAIECINSSCQHDTYYFIHCSVRRPTHVTLYNLLPKRCLLCSLLVIVILVDNLCPYFGLTDNRRPSATYTTSISVCMTFTVVTSRTIA